jgi:hypothetical protein
MLQICDATGSVLYDDSYTLLEHIHLSRKDIDTHTSPLQFGYIKSLEKVSLLQQQYIRIKFLNQPSNKCYCSQLILRGVASTRVGGVYLNLIKRCLKSLLEMCRPLPQDAGERGERPKYYLTIPGCCCGELCWSTMWQDISSIIRHITAVLISEECHFSDMCEFHSYHVSYFDIHGNNSVSFANSNIYNLSVKLSLDLIMSCISTSAPDTPYRIHMTHTGSNIEITVTRTINASDNSTYSSCNSGILTSMQYKRMKSLSDACYYISYAYSNPALVSLTNATSSTRVTGTDVSNAHRKLLKWKEDICKFMCFQFAANISECDNSTSAHDTISMLSPFEDISPLHNISSPRDVFLSETSFMAGK